MSRSLDFARRLAVLVLVLLVLAAGRASAQSPGTPFATWLAGLRSEALAKGISPAVVAAALDHARLVPEVIRRDHHQPELTLTFGRYRNLLVTPARIAAGRHELAAHRRLLGRIARRYGVPSALIVALWGIESDYGVATGDFAVVPALVTLAYEGSGARAHYFRSQVFYALRIIARDRLRPAALRGSWAGAMGQSQFMPSTYWRYAVHFAGPGHPDIWHSTADIFASTANYLAQAGWRRGQGWGVRVRLLRPLHAQDVGYGENRPLKAWLHMGVRPLAGHRLPSWLANSAALVLPQGEPGPAYLVGPNFAALMNWNRSVFFGLAAGLLERRIASQ